jgi:hypothetical protein
MNKDLPNAETTLEASRVSEVEVKGVVGKALASVN